MNEVEAYRAVYGDLVEYVPHYKDRLRLTILAFKNRQEMENFRRKNENHQSVR